MWTIGYFSKPAFLAFLDKFLLSLLVTYQSIEVEMWIPPFLLEEALGAGCSVFICGRLISGWADLGQFVQTKPSNIFLDSSLSCMNMLHPQQHMFKAQNLTSFTSGQLCLWLFVSLPELSVSTEQAFVLCPVKSCWKMLAQRRHEFYPLHSHSITSLFDSSLL